MIALMLVMAGADPGLAQVLASKQLLVGDLPVTAGRYDLEAKDLDEGTAGVAREQAKLVGELDRAFCQGKMWRLSQLAQGAAISENGRGILDRISNAVADGRYDRANAAMNELWLELRRVQPEHMRLVLREPTLGEVLKAKQLLVGDLPVLLGRYDLDPEDVDPELATQALEQAKGAGRVSHRFCEDKLQRLNGWVQGRELSARVGGLLDRISVTLAEGRDEAANAAMNDLQSEMRSAKPMPPLRFGH